MVHINTISAAVAVVATACCIMLVLLPALVMAEEPTLHLDPRTSPPGVHQPGYNFGLPFKVTHLARFEVAMQNGKHDGSFLVALFGSIAPKTVDNFVHLCNHEYEFGYVNSTFHRIVRGFIVQGGDFESHEGFGGHSIYNEKGKFQDETYVATHQEGSVSMAAEGVEDNGSQFFLVGAKDAQFLDGVHVVFGHVVDGYRTTVRRMLNVPVDTNDIPRDPVVVTNCTAWAHDEDARVPPELRRAPASRKMSSKKFAREGRQREDNADGERHDESNKKVEGPRRPTDPPHRRMRHMDERARLYAEREERDYENLVKKHGARHAPVIRDERRRKIQEMKDKMAKAREARRQREKEDKEKQAKEGKDSSKVKTDGTPKSS